MQEDKTRKEKRKGRQKKIYEMKGTRTGVLAR